MLITPLRELQKKQREQQQKRRYTITAEERKKRSDRMHQQNAARRQNAVSPQPATPVIQYAARTAPSPARSQQLQPPYWDPKSVQPAWTPSPPALTWPKVPYWDIAERLRLSQPNPTSSASNVLAIEAPEAAPLPLWRKVVAGLFIAGLLWLLWKIFSSSGKEDFEWEEGNFTEAEPRWICYPPDPSQGPDVV